MAFKAMDSFLRYITMGAVATQHVWRLLEQHGYQIIELEQYASSNKIWQTKVKRLRLPDLMCVKTGVRFEVRAKSNLKIEMSHAPGNPDRYWDAGLRDHDVVILVKAYEDRGEVRIGNQINGFRVDSLRACQDDERVGGPKANTEGSERTITWPAWVPSGDGIVESVERNLSGAVERVRVRYDDGRTYAYSRMEGKYAYLREGDRFVGNEQFVVGLPAEQASLYADEPDWTPAKDFDSDDTGDRFAAVKAYTRLDPTPVVDRLRHVVGDANEDVRIRLEAAGVLACRGIHEGIVFLSNHALDESGDVDVAWVMESVFILSEIVDNEDARDVMRQVLAMGRHAEARAAAAWGLGNTIAGLPILLNYLDDQDETVVAHAAVAASRLVRDVASTQTVSQLFAKDDRIAAAASEVLVRADRADLSVLMARMRDSASETMKKWAFATLARRDADHIRSHSQWIEQSEQFRQALEYAWFGPEHSWLVERDVAAELNSLEIQQLSTRNAVS